MSRFAFSLSTAPVTSPRSIAALFQAIRHPTVIAVIALGITQIIAWGTSFYALGVLAKPIVADTGWSNALVFGGLTIALLAAGAISTPAGAAIDRYGARAVMGLGFIALGVSLAALSLVQSPAAYLAVWVALGLAMRLTLYDAAFAALVQIDPARGRRAIAYLTLFGGFASTAGWPVGHLLNEAIGWRDTLLVFALTNLAVCLPLAWFGIARGAPETEHAADESKTRETAARPLEGTARRTAMVLFSIVMSANAFAFGVGAVHLVGIIEASGVGVATAVAFAALKGVAQVGGRLGDLLFGRYIPPMMLARIAIGLLPIAFVFLLAFTGRPEAALAFVLTFGVSNGLVTIVRGAVPLALFGSSGYGMILGILATPILIFNAVAPLAFAMIVDWSDYRFATWVLLAVAVLAMVAMEILAAWYRRRQTAAEPGHEAPPAG